MLTALYCLKLRFVSLLPLREPGQGRECERNDAAEQVGADVEGPGHAHRNHPTVRYQGMTTVEMSVRTSVH